MLTLSQILQYVRAETGELDGSKVDDTQLTRYVNYEQAKVQNELVQINFKSFVKRAYNTGHIFTEPTDLLQFPNAIINLQVSTGAKASAVNTVGSSGTITLTAREPGTSSNGWVITFTNTGSLSVSLNFTARTGTVGFNATVTTIAEVITALNADVTFSKYFIASGTSTSQTMVNVSTEFTLANGTGNGWYPADEVSNENSARISLNNYKAPTATSPKYRRVGNSTPTKVIEILPNTVTFSSIEYYYKLPDLSATTDTLYIPAELEELVLVGVQARVYEKIGNSGKKTEMVNEYEVRWKKYIEGYFGKRESELKDKERLQSNDIDA